MPCWQIKERLRHLLTDRREVQISICEICGACDKTAIAMWRQTAIIGLVMRSENTAINRKRPLKNAG